MSERTGLLDLEVSLLQVVEAATPTGEAVGSELVLAAVEAAGLLGPRHGYAVLLDLAVPWRRHVPLVDFLGNWGSPAGDTAADARYTSLGLGPAGRLALAAERGDVGPVPFGLVDGSWWRGGLLPPYDPASMVAALRSGEAAGLEPRSVTGGTVRGELDELAAGRPARLVAASTVVFEPRVDQPVLPARDAPEGAEGGWWIHGGQRIAFAHGIVCDPGWLRQSTKDDRLVVTELPYGVHLDDVTRHLTEHAQQEDGKLPHRMPYERDADVRPRPLGPVRDVIDESDRRGPRLVCRLRPDTDPDAARAWILSTWPLTVTIDSRLPAPLAELVAGWDAGDGSGLDAFEALVATPG